jgi:hypothetical protein
MIEWKMDYWQLQKHGKILYLKDGIFIHDGYVGALVDEYWITGVYVLNCYLKQIDINTTAVEGLINSYPYGNLAIPFIEVNNVWEYIIKQVDYGNYVFYKDEDDY